MIHKFQDRDLFLEIVFIRLERIMSKEKKIESTFITELTTLINKYSLENASDTPDHILAKYLQGCLNNFNVVLSLRQEWYQIDNSGEDETSS